MSTGAEGSAGRGRLLRVAVVMVAALVILGGVFAFTLYNNAEAATVATDVHAAFARHLTDFTSANETSLMADFTPNATLAWVGETRGLGGTPGVTTVATPSLIGSFYSRFFVKFPSFSVSNVTYAVQAVGSGAVVNGSLVLLGGGPNVQSIMGQVTTTATYVHVNGEWLISSETWNFVNLLVQSPLEGE